MAGFGPAFPDADTGDAHVTTKEELQAAVDGFVSALLQKSTEILREPVGVPFSTEEGAQTLEDVVRMLASSTIKANTQKWVNDVPTPDSRAWPF